MLNTPDLTKEIATDVTCGAGDAHSSGVTDLIISSSVMPVFFLIYVPCLLFVDCGFCHCDTGIRFLCTQLKIPQICLDLQPY